MARQAVMLGTQSNWLRRRLRYGDRPWHALLTAMALVVLVLVLVIGWLLWRDSAGARAEYGWSFLLPTRDPAWDPVLDEFQAWPFVYGTLVTSAIALVISMPISLGVAIFLAELSPAWLRLPLGWLVELLAAIPSVIYGLWGIFVFLPVVVTPLGKALAAILNNLPLVGELFAGPVPESGASRLGAGLILAVMITPTIAAVSRDVFQAIPRSQREAALSLGATRWETIARVLLPYGLSGILGAVILGLGRALGETMAVTMVVGNSIEGTLSLLRPGYTLSSVIANQFAEAVSPGHTQVLMGLGLVLFCMSLMLNAVARMLVWRVARRVPTEGRA